MKLFLITIALVVCLTKLTVSNENPAQMLTRVNVEIDKENLRSNSTASIKNRKILGVRRFLKFLLPYLASNNSVDLFTSLHDKRHNSTTNSTRCINCRKLKLFKKIFNPVSPFLGKLLNVSSSHRPQVFTNWTQVLNSLSNQTNIQNSTNLTRIFLFRQPTIKTFAFKFIDLGNIDTNNISDIGNGSLTNRAKFLHQKDRSFLNGTVSSNESYDHIANQITMKLKSILKDILKF
jgi:hypothetical protein